MTNNSICNITWNINATGEINSNWTFFSSYYSSDNFVPENKSKKINIRIISGVNGDVDGNCKVDIFDLAKVGLCYGCEEREECWESKECYKADLSGNKKVDIFDLATVGLNYGREC